MPNCVRCKETVVSGYVVCSKCADHIRTNVISPDLEYYIDQLAEEIVLSEDIPPCPMCERGSCNQQVSGLACRMGVKFWLTEKAMKLFDGPLKTAVTTSKKARRQYKC